MVVVVMEEIVLRVMLIMMAMMAMKLPVHLLLYSNSMSVSVL